MNVEISPDIWLEDKSTVNKADSKNSYEVLDIYPPIWLGLTFNRNPENPGKLPIPVVSPGMQPVNWFEDKSSLPTRNLFSPWKTCWMDPEKGNSLWQTSYNKQILQCTESSCHTLPLDHSVIHAQIDAFKEPYSHSLFRLCHFRSHEYLHLWTCETTWTPIIVLQCPRNW
jgi:hypothetical protein